MNSAENIQNAFMVVHKTYENVNKLMQHCKTVAAEQKTYVNVVDKFLRYKSDSDFSGWYIKDFIVLFQRMDDRELENEWRDGPIYAMEIDLYNDEEDKYPTLYLSKFEYPEMSSWYKGCSPAEHWRFYFPLRNQQVMDIETNGEKTIATPKTKELGDRYYWGLRKVSSISVPLTDINAENVPEKIFGEFDKL